MNDDAPGVSPKVCGGTDLGGESDFLQKVFKSNVVTVLCLYQRKTGS